MTEQETIIRLTKEIDILNKAPVHVNKLSDVEISVEARKTAISALEEIQQYRALGTVEQIKKIVSFLSLEGETGLIDDANLLNQYRALGTVEELREAREKQVPKKPIFAKSMMTKNTFQLCPICEKTVVYDGIKFGHCQYCGQAIDWSEEWKD